MSGITKRFGGVRALEQVNLTVRHGEVHALLGENGAGKSTLLKILRGIERPDRGTIEIQGERVQQVTPTVMRRLGVGMVFQDMSLAPTLSVAQNVFLNREPRNRCGLIDDRALTRRTRELFDQFGVDLEPARLIWQLSTGQQQLTQIVKALSQRSGILILDEPTSALSQPEVERLFGLLLRLKEQGVTIIYVSHRLDEVMRIADRVTILRDGRHVITASLTELSLAKIIEHVVGHGGTRLFDLRRLYVRLRSEDHLLLRERAQGRGMASATYASILVRTHLRSASPLPDRELGELKRTVAELGAIGRNLNQITKAANQNGRLTGPSTQDLHALLRACTALKNHVRELILANTRSWETGRA